MNYELFENMNYELFENMKVENIKKCSVFTLQQYRILVYTVYQVQQNQVLYVSTGAPTPLLLAFCRPFARSCGVLKSWLCCSHKPYV